MESFLYGLVIAWGLGILFGIFILKTPAKGAPEGVEPPASYEVCGTTGC